MTSPTIRAVDRFKRLAARITGKKANPEGKDGIELPIDGRNDPQTLAAKIRHLIDAIPIPSSDSPRTVPSPRKPPARDKSGKPIPPPDAARTKDEELISYLSSATVMNGKGTSRESVWSILDSLGAPRHDTQSGDGGVDDGASDILDDSSIMMYSPLVPAADSVVELAETQLVLPDAAHTPQTPAFQTLVAIQSLSWWPPKFWPFTAWNHDDDKADTPPVRVWVPSTTKLSFQVMWWGYRIYLPPPILAILNDKQLEAAKRAAMITTALTWFFSHIPVASLPPTIQPAVLLLQKLVPFVGYIGTFISWSWSTIKGYDVGYGVYLTATWILPVALIPGTWQSYDFPSTSPDSSSKTPVTTIPSNPSNTPPSTPAPAVPPPATSVPTPVAGGSSGSAPANGLWKYLRGT